MADPWLKFFPTDWRADPRLRMCSMAARGLWIEIIALMHDATPYGYLLVSGHSPTDAQIAVLVGAPSSQVTDWIGELEQAGVFSRTKDGTIYSRKMTRMQKKSAVARNNGRLGGNPSLCKERDNPTSVNLEDKGRHKPQKPEARSQKEDKDKSLSCAIASRFSEFWDAYPHRGGVKRNRKGSEQKYANAVKRGISEQTMIDAARAHQSDKTVRDGFARDPVTWLNQEGWADEAAESSSMSRSQHIAKFGTSEGWRAA